MSKKVGKYDLIAKYYDNFDSYYENKVYHKMRGKYIEEIKNSNILEVGVGTGKNLQYYDQSNRILAVDSSAEMLKEAKKKIFSLPIQNQKKIELKKISNGWDLMPNFYNYVIASFVLCTNSDPSKLIKNVFESLEPNGKLILFEWVPPKNSSRLLILKMLHPFLKYFLGVSVYRDQSLKYFDKQKWSLVTKEFFDSENVVFVLQKKVN